MEKQHVVRKRWFEVDVEGMREFHGGRQGWQLAKELVSNSFDEEVTFCRFQLAIDGYNAKLVVEDDGPGFRDAHDAYTMLGSTYKRVRPDLRGRFNLGEKEAISVSKSATIETVGQRIVFAETGERIETLCGRKRGTRIELILPWTPNKVERTIARMKRLLSPKGVKYTVNGEDIPYRKPYNVFEATLETVILERNMMRKSMHKTEVHLHKTSFGDRAMLFELGIPIQSIECGVHVDVRQKVPMNPNRDAVKPKFLQDLYAEVLNNTIDLVPKNRVSQGWVRQAVEDSRTKCEVLQKVVEKRFGDKTVLWSSNTRANEKALESGYELVKPQTLSAEERERLVEAGLKHSSDVFPNEGGNITVIDKPDQYMTAIGEYTKRLAEDLIGRNVLVEFYKQSGRVMACYSRTLGTISFNVTVLGRGWFKQNALKWENGGRAKANEIIAHEFGHERADPNFEHGPEFRRAVEELAGKLTELALKKPELFGLSRLLQESEELKPVPLAPSS